MTTWKDHQQVFTLHDVTQRLQLDQRVVARILMTLIQKGYLVEVEHCSQTNSYEACAVCPHRLTHTFAATTTFAWTQSYEEGETKPMIHLIMAELKRNRRALSLPELSQQLQVDRFVLDGIVTMLVKRGYLVEVPYMDVAEPCECGCATCPRRQVDTAYSTYQLAETPDGKAKTTPHT